MTTTVSPVTQDVPTRRRPRVAAVIVAVLAVLAAPVVWVQGAATDERAVDDVDPVPVAIVLGAKVRPDGSPSTYLMLRLSAAAELYANGTVEVLLVSGDRSGDDYDEPAVMRSWLVAHGVPAERVVMDGAGYDTHDSCVRAHDVYGVDEAVVISQDYHLPRALFLCGRAGIEAQGVGVSAESATPAKLWGFRAREVPASFKAAWDGLTHRVPVGGLEPSSAVEDALDLAGTDPRDA